MQSNNLEHLPLSIFIWIITWVQVSDAKFHSCPEAAQQMGICLHTYLERDFIGLEPYVQPQDTRPLTDGPEIEIHCSNLNELVTCYGQLDGSCYHLLVRMRYSYMINGLFGLFKWLCDEQKELKDLLENLHCIEQVRQDSLCKMSNVPANVWQKMLRLEIEDDAETCRSISRHVTCIDDSKRMQNHCGNQSHELFIRGMRIWLDNWCLNSAMSVRLKILSLILPLVTFLHLLRMQI